MALLEKWSSKRERAGTLFYIYSIDQPNNRFTTKLLYVDDLALTTTSTFEEAEANLTTLMLLDIR